MNENLLRLIYSHKKCGLTDEQILSVFLGMGVVEQVAKDHLEYYKKYIDNKKDPMATDDLKLDTGFQVKGENKTNINIKENNNTVMKKLNIIQLYENLSTAARELHEMATTKANASYSAITAYSIIEQAMSNLPSEVSLLASRKRAGLPVDDTKVNPALKYEVAESVYSMLNGSILVPAKVLCEYIKESMESDKWGYVGAKVMKACGAKSSNNMYAALYEQVASVLLSDNIYENLKKVVSESEFWCSESKQVVALMESEQYGLTNELNKTVVENSGYTMVAMFSPILESEEGVSFNLYGKNYMLKDGKVMECKVADKRYNDVVNGLRLMAYNAKDNTLEYYGVNGKVLEYHLNEGKINLGSNDMTNLASIDLRNSLSISGLFSKATVGDIDVLTKMFESRDLIGGLDSCINLKSELTPGLFLTLISVEEGYYVNVVNYNTLVNEMRYFKSATAAKNFIKESFNYDATTILREALKAEGDKNAAILENRNKIQERIDFLKEKRGEVMAKIESMPSNIDSTSLVEALNLLECEIKDNECALADTFKQNLCGDNCVEVKVCNVVGTLNPGDIVYVDAAAFTAAPDCSTISVTDPKTGSAIVVNKSDLVFDLNHQAEEPKCCDNGDCKCNPNEPVVAPNNNLGDDNVLIGECGGKKDDDEE